MGGGEGSVIGARGVEWGNLRSDPGVWGELWVGVSTGIVGGVLGLLWSSDLSPPPSTPFTNELYPPTPPSPPRQCAMAALTPRTNAAVTAPTWTPSTSEKWGGRGGTRRWGGGAGGRWAPRGGPHGRPPITVPALQERAGF